MTDTADVSSSEGRHGAAIAGRSLARGSGVLCEQARLAAARPAAEGAGAHALHNETSALAFASFRFPSLTRS